MKLGIEKTAMIRARAAISFDLSEALNDGHCGLPRDELLPMAINLLEIPAAIIQEAMGARTRTGAGAGHCRPGLRPGLHLPGRPLLRRAIDRRRLKTIARGALPGPEIDANGRARIGDPKFENSRRKKEECKGCSSCERDYANKVTNSAQAFLVDTM
jgi:hypothetical protein